MKDPLEVPQERRGDGVALSQASQTRLPRMWGWGGRCCRWLGAVGELRPPLGWQRWTFRSGLVGGDRDRLGFPTHPWLHPGVPWGLS